VQVATQCHIGPEEVIYLIAEGAWRSEAVLRCTTQLFTRYHKRHTTFLLLATLLSLCYCSIAFAHPQRHSEECRTQIADIRQSRKDYSVAETRGLLAGALTLPLCHLSLSGLMYCTLGVGEHVGEHRRGTGELSFVAQADSHSPKKTGKGP
jgi:hypothetical protein